VAADPAVVTGRARGRARREGYGRYLIPGLLGFLAIIVVPFGMNIGISLFDWDGVGRARWTGLSNYHELFGDEVFWASFRHNVVIIGAMAVVPTVLGLVLAYTLFDFVARRFGPRTATVLRACFYLPQVLPIAVAGIVWAWILSADNGAVNAALQKVGLGSLAHDWLGDEKVALLSVSLVLVWVQLGFPLVVFMSGLQRIDPGLYEAAELDGASWWRRLWHITIPQLRPEIYVVLLWTTIAALKVFPPIYVLTKGGPGDATNVPAYYSYQNFFEKTKVGYGASIAVILTLIVLALTIAFLRFQRGQAEED
jgi:raffinose/stachyose/melibiose transport system permease protein